MRRAVARTVVYLGRISTLVLVCASLAACPSAVAATNEVSVSFVDGEANAVASCQLIVLAGAILYLETEDGLGLATLPRGDPLPALLQFASLAAPVSSCESIVRTLRVHGGAPTRMTGGAPIGDVAGSSGSVGGALAENSVAICQAIVIVGSTVIGGASYGFARDGVDAPLVRSEGSAHSACRVGVEELVTLPD